MMTADVTIRAHGRVGHITLTRPRAINALTLEMCEAISAALLEWRTDPAVEAVIVDHGEGRGFCAGGEVRTAVGPGPGATGHRRRGVSGMGVPIRVESGVCMCFQKKTNEK